MELYIFSQDEQPLTVLSEETGLIDTHYRIEINGIPDEPFIFSVEADNPTAAYVKEENKVIFRDHEGDWRLMVIREVDDSNDLYGPITLATCEPVAIAELNDNIIEERRFSEQPATRALEAALQGTRWLADVESELGNATSSFYYLTSTEAVWKVLDVWGGEFKDVVDFDEETNEIKGCYIKLIQRHGSEHGQRFEIDNNTTEIGRTVLSYPKTALYGRGSSLEVEDEDGEHTGGYTRYIDFADVEWKVSNGDPVDKPKGQKWVGDPEALDAYGYEGGEKHRFGIFSNQDYEDEGLLLYATWEALQQAKKPEVNYRLEVDLFDEKVSLGDTCQAIDRKFARPIEIQARVIAMEYDLMDIEGTMVVEMGQFLDLGDNRLDDLEREVEGIKNNPPSAVIDEDSYPNVILDAPINVEANGSIDAIQLYWDYDYAVYLKHYEVYGSRTEDFIPDTQHLLWRGDVSSFAHIVGTDEVWFYRVRAVNYHGTPSEWSEQVRGATHRVISDDILFGPDIAEELRELSKEAKILAEGSVSKEELEKAITDEIDTARNQANEAVANANIATSNALEAIEDAQKAFDKATSASDDASVAKGIAEATEDLAKAIKTTVDGHSTEITATKEALGYKMNTVDADAKFATQSQLTATSNSLQSRIAEVQWGVDQIPINERNLLTDDNTQIIGSSLLFGADDINDKTLTLSIQNSEYQGIWDLYYIITFADGTNKQGVVDSAGSYTTFSENKEIDSIALSVENASIKDFYAAKIQLEKGDEVTPWGMPPQDLITGVKFSELTQTVDSITAQVTEKVDKSTYNSFVQQTAQSLSSKISEQDANAKFATQSSLTQTAQGLQSSVKSVRDDLDGLEVGGRNLITDSSEPYTFSIDDYNYRYLIIYRGLERNTTYTFSSKVEVLQGDVTSISIYPYLSPGEGMTATAVPIVNGRIEWTFTTDDRYDYNLLVYNGVHGSTAGNQVRLTEYQLEKGNKATDWSPAVEDMATQSQITQLSDVISSKITKGQADGWYASQSQLTQTASSLQSTIKGVRDDLDGLEVGGANLNRDSNNFSPNVLSFYDGSALSGHEENVEVEEWGATDATEIRAGAGNATSFLKVIKTITNTTNTVLGKTYTISFYVKNLRTSKMSVNVNGITPRPTVDIEPNEAKRIVVTGERSSNALQIQFYSPAPTMYTHFIAWRAQVEDGNKVTPWSPSYEDMATQSQFSQLSDAINLRVQKGDVVNQINVDTSGVLIAGNKVRITGQTTIDNGAIKNAAIANAAITSAKIASAAVGTAAIANGAITRAKIGDAVIGRAQIEDGSIVTAKLGLASVRTANIVDAAITNAKIANLNVNKLVGSVATFVQNNFNNVSSEVSITGAGLETRFAGQRSSLLDGTGHHFYRYGNFTGYIGASSVTGVPTYMGLSFNMTNASSYMAWAYDYNGDGTYSSVLEWHKNNSRYEAGFTFNDHLKVSSSKVLYLRTLSTYKWSDGNRHISLRNYQVEGQTGVAFAYGNSGTGSKLFLGGSSAYLLNNGTSYIRVASGSGSDYVESVSIFNRTYTASSQAVRVTVNGILGRITSSRRYKLLEKPISLEYAKRFLDISAKTWYDKQAVEDYAKTLETGKEAEDKEDIRRIPGLIAEDMHDAGLDLFVNYDDKGRPDGITSNTWVLHTPLIQDLYTRASKTDDELEQLRDLNEDLVMKVARLEQRIKQLEESA